MIGIIVANLALPLLADKLPVFCGILLNYLLGHVYNLGVIQSSRFKLPNAHSRHSSLNAPDLAHTRLHPFFKRGLAFLRLRVLFHLCVRFLLSSAVRMRRNLDLFEVVDVLAQVGHPHRLVAYLPDCLV